MGNTIKTVALSSVSSLPPVFEFAGAKLISDDRSCFRPWPSWFLSQLSDG